MTTSNPLAPPESIFQCLAYDPISGQFTWIRPTCRRLLAGSAAGTLDDKGYVLIAFKGRRYKAHRLAWYFMTGTWPGDVVDHRNGVKSDNSFANLREATKSQNGANAGLWRNNTSGIRGVRFDGSKWTAGIGVAGKFRHLGSFNDPASAQAAYKAAAEQHFGEYARVQSGEPCRVFITPL